MLLQTGKSSLTAWRHTRTLRHEIRTACRLYGALLGRGWLLGSGHAGEKTGHTQRGYKQAASAVCTFPVVFEHRTSPWECDPAAS